MIVGLDIKTKKMKCSQCKTEIKNKYYRLDQFQKVYCELCYSKNSKCQVCGLPSLEVYLVQDLKVCIDCYSNKYSCRACSRDIKGKELKYIWGIQGFFCISCINSKTKCSHCRFPVYSKDSLLEVDKDIHLCESCQGISILSEEVAKNVIINIARILYIKMGIQLVKNIDLKLITRKEMKDLYIENGNDIQLIGNENENFNLLGFTKRDGNSVKIFVVNGLILSNFVSVLTHEYARAWQLKFCSKHIGRVIWEGFAEWTATKMLSLLGYHE
ncbi:MAG: hypothetical protein OEV44_07505, partial [Spirochaetota bacterium]|nr:hypothetical protein [Spirochaetota bacterium]